MELHYVTLMEGFRFVGTPDGATAVSALPLPVEGVGDPEMMATDFETTVFDSFRFLRRSAVACVTFPPHASPADRSVEASFLVERAMWGNVRDAVVEEQRRLRDVAIEQDGPLPPYDFVRLQFGA
jgi:hypothetical protein